MLRVAVGLARVSASRLPARRSRSISGGPEGVGVYIHWPFCVRKCTYCNFNKYVDNDVDYDRLAPSFVQRLLVL
jgi:coproporphyrinogen III oxidase-like Fe-S oxidoreductase